MQYDSIGDRCVVCSKGQSQSEVVEFYFTSISGPGSGVWGLGSRVWGLGSGVWSLGFGVWGSRFEKLEPQRRPPKVRTETENLLIPDPNLD